MLISMYDFFVFFSDCVRTADLVFIVDSSSSLSNIDQTWPRIRNTVIAIMDNLPEFGPNQYHFGLVQVGTDPYLLFNLGEGDKNNLRQKVAK